ncbi:MULTISPECIES: DUF6602 domain-containing protein [Pseudomonas]|uniref:DUF6602 domain-containing protein n=1 Tax=Pseudomonas TaxID=286 RepID=UPI00168B0844|nr:MULTISPECIES: DUF6602 domain-containing protein [Pseudomonas]MCE0780172.1 hypothetical protein [Pseudomonas sp. NMI542_15]MCE0974541.1 hypothetical protein [Pseudomonas putida]QNL87590.1 Uncharacterized protein PPKH_2176 [Pseudomonas putida]
MKVLAEVLQKLVVQKKALLNDQRVKHPTLIGDMYEGLTAEVLERIDLSRYGVKVVSGIITSGSEQSGQIDCMVVIGKGDPILYTKHFYYPIDQVIAVFEVKKNLFSRDLRDAYGQLEKVFQLSKRDYDRQQAQGILEFNTTRPAQEFLTLFGNWPCHYEENAKLPFHQRAVYQSLVRDWLTPLRIALGYNGYKTEKGLREGLFNLYEGMEEVPGYGVVNMPNLMVSDGYSIIKLNGMPYRGSWNEEAKEWYWLSSSDVNPMLLILELLYDRVELLLNVRLDRGQDLDEEPYFPLLLSTPMERDGAAPGWIHKYYDEPISKRSSSQRSWAPLKISTVEKEFLRLIHQQGPQFLGATKLAAFMSEYGITDIRQSMRALFEARAVLETNNVFSISAGKWAVARIRGSFYCGDNAGNRFVNWLELRTVPLRYPVKMISISPFEVGPMQLFPVVG